MCNTLRYPGRCPWVYNSLRYPGRCPWVYTSLCTMVGMPSYCVCDGSMMHILLLALRREGALLRRVLLSSLGRMWATLRIVFLSSLGEM